MNRFLPVMIMLLVVSGCAREALRADYGYSVENNLAVQAHNPYASQADMAAPPMVGEKSDAAVERYLTDEGELEEDRIVEDVSSSGN